MANDDLPAVALIAGPTASGKSALALALAARTPATIVNADSAQVYRDLRLLSARPSAAEEAQAPHRLFGHRDGAEPCSAADWAGEAKAAIAEAQGAGRLPVLVGGTGLYIKTLLDGIAPVPPIDPAVRARVRALPVAQAAMALAAEDPAAAARLAPSDTTRIARALEVVRSTGRPLAAWQAARSGGIAGRVRLVPIILLPPRDWLRARIATRFAAMMAGGAGEEVAALLARGLDPALPVMRAIGVPEIAAWLRGQMDAAAAVDAAVTASRRYAKRQRTWLAHQLPPEWPRIEQPMDDALTAQLAIKLHEQALT
ncbi:MAG: tRNA (adenosine(37)-N6)-dimethylallyltransferase MiaA [Sphingomonas fennica]